MKNHLKMLWFIWCKPLSVMFDRANGFVRDYNGDKHLALFFPERYDKNFHRIRYLIGLKKAYKYKK